MTTVEVQIGQTYRENRVLWRDDPETIARIKVPASENQRRIRILTLVGSTKIGALVLTDITGRELKRPRHVRLSRRTLAKHYVMVEDAR